MIFELPVLIRQLSQDREGIAIDDDILMWYETHECHDAPLAIALAAISL